MVAEADGEDSAGRQKWKHINPDQLVQKACDIAEKAMEEFKSRGWILDLPEPVYEENDKPAINTMIFDKNDEDQPESDKDSDPEKTPKDDKTQ